MMTFFFYFVWPGLGIHDNRLNRNKTQKWLDSIKDSDAGNVKTFYDNQLKIWL